MKKYIELSKEQLLEKQIIVYGTGVFGNRCIKKLSEMGITPLYCSDIDKKKWGEMFHGIEIIAPSNLKQIDNILVIVAIEQFYGAYTYLLNLGLVNVAIYYSQKIYLAEEINFIAGNTISDIEDYLVLHKFLLYGEKKHILDVKYIFDCFRDTEYISFGEENLLQRPDETILVVCELYTKEMENRLKKEGYIKNRNLIFVEDIFPLLDEDNKIIGKIPSIMLTETVFDSMKNQIKCLQPFNKMQLSSDFSVHCCCGDWAENWGNLLNNSMEEIWNSSVAKIFRLSIINRTYTFCKEDRCVHMSIKPEPTEERISPEYVVTKIPEYIEVGIDKTCNLYCESCRDCVIVESGSKKKKIEEISEKIKASNWLESAKMLLLGGQGEVFVSPVYKSLMYDGASKRESLDLRTNGTAFSKNDLLRLIEKYNSVRIIVSIDAATETTYNQLRRSNRKDTYSILCKNMELLSEYRKSGKIDFLQINMCVQMKNYREIPDFVAYGESLGVDMIYLSPIRNWGTYSTEEFKKVGIFACDKKVKNEVMNVVNTVKSNKLVRIAF